MQRQDRAREGRILAASLVGTLVIYTAAIVVSLAFAIMGSINGTPRDSEATPSTAAAPEATQEQVQAPAQEPEEVQALEEVDTTEPTPETDDERTTFVQTWAERIDAFNAGYPLEGYGAAFAEAAYDNDVDPRYSPAIARVESGSGQNCFYPYNAWGWGSESWSDWDTAIRDHVAGLAAGYGHTLTYEAALSYDSAEADEWYAQVEASMAQIWESEEL